MKKTLSILAAGMLFLAGCKEPKKDVTVTTPEQVPVATVATTAKTEGTSSSVSIDKVPDSVKVLFAQKYPKALKTSWMKYEPVESDDMKMDDQYYYAVFDNGGSDYTAWYNNRGEWVKTSTRIPTSSVLPEAVMNTLNRQYPGYNVDEIDKENDKDMDMYEMKLRKGDEKVKLKILPNGTIFKKK